MPGTKNIQHRKQLAVTGSALTARNFDISQRRKVEGIEALA
jgi:hypothetical protein